MGKGRSYEIQNRNNREIVQNRAGKRGETVRRLAGRYMFYHSDYIISCLTCFFNHKTEGNGG